MTAQAIHLIAQRLLCDFKILRLPVRPALPEIAAAPASHDQDSLAVGEIEELFGFKLSFETNRVQPQVPYIPKFVVQSLRVFPKHHVRRPAPAPDQNIFAVDLEGAAAG